MQDAIFVAIALRHDGFERSGHKHLITAGFAALYTAHLRETMTRGRRGKPKRDTVIEWLTPGYILLAHDGTPDFWRRVSAVQFPRSRTPVMAYPVRIAGSEVVHAYQVRDLIARCGELVPAPQMPRLKTGDRARILADPFAGYTGEVGDVGDDRVEVFVSLFGRASRFVTTPDKIEKVVEAA